VEQEEGGETVRTLYDGMSFEVIREGEVFRNGAFTTNGTGGAAAAPAEGSGTRYRWIGEESGVRTRGGGNEAGVRYTGTGVTLSGLYNYGYRDYKPEAARFTTVDPVKDGNNWYSYVNNDPVNWIDPWGLNPADAAAIRDGLIAAAATGYNIPVPAVTVAAVIVTGVVVIDIITDGAITQGVTDLVNNISNWINETTAASRPVRDIAGNPIPVGNQTQPATGRGANAGPENINDPGDLGGPNFKLPKDLPPIAGAIIGAAVITSAYDALTDAAGSPPNDYSPQRPDTPSFSDLTGPQFTSEDNNIPKKGR
jgi:RHS repeat-associated protein